MLQQSQSHTELLYCLHILRCVHVMFRSFCFEKFCRSHKVGGGPVTNFHHFEYFALLAGLTIPVSTTSLSISIGQQVRKVLTTI